MDLQNQFRVTGQVAFRLMSELQLPQVEVHK